MNDVRTDAKDASDVENNEKFNRVLREYLEIAETLKRLEFCGYEDVN